MAETGRRFRPALRALVMIRLKEFVREPEAVFWMYIFPILLAAGLGIAFRNQAPEPARVGWAEWTPADARFREALSRDSMITLVPLADSAAAAQALRTGTVSVVVLSEAGGVRYRLDDTRPEASVARLRADQVLQRAAGRIDPLAPSSEIVREPGSRYIDFLLPGLIGMNLMGSIWVTGFAIVDARRRKLLKRLAATPMARADYLASFLITPLLLLAFEVGATLTFGRVVFDVPMRGAIGTLMVACVCGSLCFSSLGLLVASRPATIEGASGMMNFIMLPMWVLSGVFFSAARFPEAVQPVIRALPLTAVVDALRAIMLEGRSLGGIVPQLLVLLAWVAVGFLSALKLFRWQ
ncbi:MAG: ABC transporter permease [Gemmatimonadales bacterium]